MSDNHTAYILGSAPNEVERLSAWADAWESSVEALFNQVGIQPGWRCIDLGCGPRGVLAPLGQRVGPSGRVVGIDLSEANISAAREHVTAKGLTNVELNQADAFHTNQPRESFDLVHTRFMFTPLGRDDELLQEMLDLARPNGIIIIQESCEAGYECHPPQAAWQRLKEVTIAAFSLGGGDYNAGRRTYGLLRKAGCQSMDARAAVLALPAGHRFRYWPLDSATALQYHILNSGLMTKEDFNSTLDACRRIADDPDIWITSFMVTQVWGRKPSK